MFFKSSLVGFDMFAGLESEDPWKDAHFLSVLVEIEVLVVGTELGSSTRFAY